MTRAAIGLGGNLGDAAWRFEAIWTDPSRDVWFLEAPLAPEDVAGHAELVARSAVPI